MKYMSLETFNKVVDIMIKSGLVKREHHVLYWIDYDNITVRY